MLKMNQSRQCGKSMMLAAGSLTLGVPAFAHPGGHTHPHGHESFLTEPLTAPLLIVAAAAIVGLAYLAKRRR
jgi:hypothetical protein